MGKLEVSGNKTLKLQNVLLYQLEHMEDGDLDVIIEQMQSYIRAKGAAQIGPFIQYVKTEIMEDGQPKIAITFLLQCDRFLHSVQQPYTMESVMRVTNCMYCRFSGPEEKLKFAYDKIMLEAYEKDIPLKGGSYTVFVHQDNVEETITADVFMERADG